MTNGDNETPSVPVGPGVSGSHEVPPGMPVWVKYLLGALVAVALLAVLAMLLVGGDHGPGRHGAGPGAGPGAGMHSAPAGAGVPGTWSQV